MKKIIGYIPLDDRPCNYVWPQKILKNTEFELLLPPRDIMGRFNVPADREKVCIWLREHVKSMDALVISLDLLAHGGLVASRRLVETIDEIREKIKILEELKKLNPSLVIYGFSILMRISITVDSPESERNWKNLYEYSKVYYRIHQLKQVELTDRLKQLQSDIPSDILNHYLKTRERNFTLNKEFLDLLENKYIDFIAYAQEDAAEYGFHREEQAELRKLVRKRELLDKVELVTGADEIGTLLLARYINISTGYTPRIFLDYTYDKGKFFIAPYEDCCLNISVEEHIRLLKGIQGAEADNSDIVLLCHNSEEKALDLFTSYPEEFKDTGGKIFLKMLRKYLNMGKAIAISDVFYTNGGDPALVSLLVRKKYLKHISSYAGLNTTSNTIGLTLAQVSMVVATKLKENQIIELLIERILEDCYYQTIVRRKINKRIVSDGFSPVKLSEKGRIYEEEIKNMLMTYLKTMIEKEKLSLKSFNAFMPWDRTFEVEIDMELE